MNLMFNLNKKYIFLVFIIILTVTINKRPILIKLNKLNYIKNNNLNTKSKQNLNFN